MRRGRSMRGRLQSIVYELRTGHRVYPTENELDAPTETIDPMPGRPGGGTIPLGANHCPDQIEGLGAPNEVPAQPSQTRTVTVMETDYDGRSEYAGRSDSHALLVPKRRGGAVVCKYCGFDSQEG